jgi:ribosomal protein S18 acetylase RimI-like enzyme
LGIEHGATFVAERDNVLVGFCEAIPGEILAVYVDPAWARQGVGTALLSQAWEHAAAPGGVVRLEATLNATAFYEHLGFRARSRSTVRRNDVDVGVVIMDKQAGSPQTGPTRHRSRAIISLRHAAQVDR